MTLHPIMSNPLLSFFSFAKPHSGPCVMKNGASRAVSNLFLLAPSGASEALLRAATAFLIVKYTPNIGAVNGACGLYIPACLALF